MGTTKEVFGKLNIQVPNVTYLEFPEPKKGEGLKSYAARMAEPISDDDENILVGMSMGGFIAQEISILKNIKKLVLIASFTEGQDWQPLIALVKKFKLTDLVVERAFKDIVVGALLLMPGFEKKDKELLVKMAKGFSKQYYKFAVTELVHWQPVQLNCEVIKIHGTKDELFPISNVNADFTVENGTHLMIFNHADEISKYLEQAIA